MSSQLSSKGPETGNKGLDGLAFYKEMKHVTV